ncbi:Calx-beta domain-containing protein [Tautonia plasticadhaerens]|uniref:Calx-beta domain protein n=1 Tax=Tautonia plasticadhaerens TaxID=2527974 RepID=A0A518H6R6_9BACT|nr:Calx-beta domain-containing protein [Tautonia plasticadhaerens]QDV36532.1 Calx-beta domain protein [Tautonia plasticadhaerens]
MRVSRENLRRWTSNSAGSFIDRVGPSSLASFTVSLDSANASPITLNYITADGTAVAGSDFSAASGTLTFAPGVTTQTILVPILDDTAVEPDETFAVILSNPVVATIVDEQGLGSIADDDATSIQVAVISPDFVSKGSSVDVTITGAGFVAGASVTFENGPGPAPSASNVVGVDSTTITATIAAPNGGPKRDRVWDVRVTNPDGSSAMLARGFTVTAGRNLMAASTAGPGTDAEPFYRWQLRFALRSTRASWRDAGADLGRLGPLHIRVADLPGTTLGRADGTTITLDRDAAGHGWFFDFTPGDASDVSEGRMDLLTAIAHELGHALGHDHDHEDDVMGEVLDPGVRRLPDRDSLVPRPGRVDRFSSR